MFDSLLRRRRIDAQVELLMRLLTAPTLASSVFHLDAPVHVDQHHFISGNLCFNADIDGFDKAILTVHSTADDGQRTLAVANAEGQSILTLQQRRLKLIDANPDQHDGTHNNIQSNALMLHDLAQQDTVMWRDVCASDVLQHGNTRKPRSSSLKR